jgi:hypothetical protein
LLPFHKAGTLNLCGTDGQERRDIIVVGKFDEVELNLSCSGLSPGDSSGKPFQSPEFESSANDSPTIDLDCRSLLYIRRFTDRDIMLHRQERVWLSESMALVWMADEAEAETDDFNHESWTGVPTIEKYAASKDLPADLDVGLVWASSSYP